MSKNLGSRLTAKASRFHPVLQDQHCGHTIDRLAALFDRKIGFAEKPVGLGGGEALIPKMDRQAKFLAQFFGEELHFFGLNAFHPAQPKRIANDDFRNLIIIDYPGKLLKSQPLVLPLKSWQTLRGKTQRIRNSHSDTPGTYI